MTVAPTEVPLGLQVLGLALNGVLFASIIAVFVGIARAIFRAGLVIDPPEDAQLPYVDRTYVRNRRAGLVFTAEKFRLERRLIGFGAVGVIGVLAVAGVMTLLFGGLR